MESSNALFALIVIEKYNWHILSNDHKSKIKAHSLNGSYKKIPIEQYIIIQLLHPIYVTMTRSEQQCP